MAFYDFKVKQGVAKNDDEKKLYPSIVYSGTMTSKELVAQVAHKSGFNAGQLEGALIELMNTAAYYIGKGFHVELGEYTELTGRMKNTALADLKAFTQKGIIQCKGRGNQMHFVRAELGINSNEANQQTINPATIE